MAAWRQPKTRSGSGRETQLFATGAQQIERSFRNTAMRVMRLQQAQKNICGGQYRHLHSASAINGVTADSLVGEQRRIPRMALYPGVKFARPLFGVRWLLRRLTLAQLLPNSFHAYIQHVIRHANQASLDSLSNELLLFGFELDRHVLSMAEESVLPGYEQWAKSVPNSNLDESTQRAMRFVTMMAKQLDP